MRHLLFASLLAAILVPWSAGADEVTPIAIIAPLAQTSRAISEAELSLIFWRKKLYWAGSKRIRPVNLSTDQALRRQFSQRVLGSLPETQTEYWNGLYYHGTSPPHVVSSEEAMLRFVAETPGAIGYVSACKADDRVDVLAWIDANEKFTTTPLELDCQPE